MVSRCRAIRLKLPEESARRSRLPGKFDFTLMRFKWWMARFGCKGSAFSATINIVPSIVANVRFGSASDYRRLFAPHCDYTLATGTCARERVRRWRRRWLWPRRWTGWRSWRLRYAGRLVESITDRSFRSVSPSHPDEDGSYGLHQHQV